MAEKKTSIIDAVDNNDVKRVLKILKDTPLDDLDLKLAFYQAIQKGNLPTVKLFLENGFNINEIDPTFGETPLMHATRHGHCDLIKYLVNNNADINKKSFYNFREGVTALHVAVSGPENNRERTKALKILVSVPNVKLNETAQDVKTPLMEAAWRGRPDAMKILIDAGCDVNYRDHLTGRTATHFCIEPHYQITTIQASVECLKLLFNSFVCLDVQDVHGATPLMYAIRRNNMPSLKALIYANCNIFHNFSLHTENPNRYLEKAIISCNMKACQLLVKAGCSYYCLRSWEGLSDCRSPHIVEWINDLLLHSRSLKDLARIAIRSRIGYYPQNKVHSLNLPTSLKEYLLLSDLEIT